MRKLQRLGPTVDPQKAQAALSQLSATERRAYMEAVEEQGAMPEAANRQMRRMQQRMQGTVWTSGCSSWYLDARGHNTTLWPGFTFEFRRRTRHFDPQHYDLIPQQASILKRYETPLSH